MHDPASPPFSVSLPAVHSDANAPATGDGAGYQPRQLVLLGSGHAHLHLLKRLASTPLVGARIILVTPHSSQLAAAMVPELVAGHLSLAHCQIALEPLVRRSGVRWLNRNVRALDAQAHCVELDDGSRLQYDWLSIDTDPVQNRSTLETRIPGAREHGLFLRPLEAFASLWPQVAAMGDARGMRFTVIGAGTAGVEMALAIRQRLPGSAITLLCDQALPGATLAPGARQRLHQTLRRQRVTLLLDRASGIHPGFVQLASGATLACDVPLIATELSPAPWLAQSGLALDAAGQPALDACLRSTSHPEVSLGVDPGPPGGTAARARRAQRCAPAVALNLAATVLGRELKPVPAHPGSLRVINSGNRRALAIWGRLHVQGRWVWLLKNWLQRRYVARMNQ